MRQVSLRLSVLIAAVSMALGISAAQGIVVNVKDYGAIGDGTHNDAVAIQAALDSGAATVVIPQGVYNVNQTLLIGSRTTLQADANAVIRLANGANTLLINNRPNASNIVVQGGIWDGNNQYNQRGSDSDPNGYSGAVLNFVGVDHLTVSDLTVRNPDAFSIRLGNVQGFTVKNISLDFSVARLNQDGVHVAGNSHHGVISGIKAITANTPNDDMVALNADDSVTSVLARGLHNGPISDVLVENLRADNAYTFVRLYGNTSTVEDITIRDIKGGFRYYAINMSNHDFPVGAGDIRNVTIDDCNVTKTTAEMAWAPAIDIGLSVQDLHITNFVRDDSVIAATLVLRNGLDNILRGDDGSERRVQNFTIQQGGLKDFWLNPAQVPEPCGSILTATGLLGLLCYVWRKRV